MDDAKRIYTLLLQSDGLKIREISQALELDAYYVAELMFSEEYSSLWYQNDSSLWFAIEGALGYEEEEDEESDEDEQASPLFDNVVNIKPIDIKQYIDLGISETAQHILSGISNYRVFSDDQTQELFQRCHDGDKEAYEQLVTGNLRHVVAVARLFINTGMPFEDIIQEGVIGLLESIKRFDYKRNKNFTYFAKLGVYRYLDLSLRSLPYQVMIPSRHVYLHHLIRRFCDDYVQREEMEPPFEFVEVKEEKLPSYLKPVYNMPADLKDVMVPMNDWDSVEDDTFLADKQLILDSEKYDLLRLVYALPDRMRNFVIEYYGLDGNPEQSLETIAKEHNLTRERVRQIVEKGRRQLQELLGLVKKKKKKEEVQGPIITSASSNDHQVRHTGDAKRRMVRKEASNQVNQAPYQKTTLTESELKRRILFVMLVSRRPMTSSEITTRVNSRLLDSKIWPEAVDYLLRRMSDVKCLEGGKYSLDVVGDSSKPHQEAHTHRPLRVETASSNGAEDEQALKKRILHVMQTNPYPMTYLEISSKVNVRAGLVVHVLERMPEVEYIKAKYSLKGTNYAASSRNHQPQYQRPQRQQELLRAVLKALKQFSVSANPNDIAIVAKRFLPSDFKLKTVEVTATLDLMADVVQSQKGRYILKSKIKKEPSAKSTKTKATEEKTVGTETHSFYPSTTLHQLVDWQILTMRECKQCHHKNLYTIGDVKKKIELYHLTRESTRFTQYTINMWFKIVDLLEVKTHKETESVSEKSDTSRQSFSLEQAFQEYVLKIKGLRQAKKHGVTIVAKPVLLLAVIEGVEEGIINDNSVVLNEWLEQRYEMLMKHYTRNSIFRYIPTINNPFWHIKNDGFWHLHYYRDGLRSLDTPSTKWLKQNVEYASLDDYLWILLVNPTMRQRLRDFIIEKKLSS